MAKSVIGCHSNDGVSNNDNTTRYFPPPCNLTNGPTNLIDCPLPYDGSVSQLKVYVGANTTAGGTTTSYTVVVNGADTAITCTYTAGQTGEKEDTSHVAAIDALDRITTKQVIGNDPSGTRSVRLHSVTVAYNVGDDSDDRAVSMQGAMGDTSFSAASTTVYWCGGAGSGNSTTERKQRLVSAYTASLLGVSVYANARTTTTIWRNRINGFDGTMSVAYLSGQTGVKEDTSNTDDYAAGDDLSLSMTTSTGTGTISMRGCYVALEASDRKHFLAMGTATGIGIAGTIYVAPIGAGSTANTTAAQGQSRVGFACEAQDISVFVATNTASGTSTATLQIEGSDSALGVSYTTGQTGLKTDTDAVAVAADDRVGWALVRGGSGTITFTAALVNLTTPAPLWYGSGSTPAPGGGASSTTADATHGSGRLVLRAAGAASGSDEPAAGHGATSTRAASFSSVVSTSSGSGETDVSEQVSGVAAATTSAHGSGAADPSELGGWMPSATGAIVAGDLPAALSRAPASLGLSAHGLGESGDAFAGASSGIVESVDGDGVRPQPVAVGILGVAHAAHGVGDADRSGARGQVVAVLSGATADGEVTANGSGSSAIAIGADGLAAILGPEAEAEAVAVVLAADGGYELGPICIRPFAASGGAITFAAGARIAAFHTAGGPS